MISNSLKYRGKEQKIELAKVAWFCQRFNVIVRSISSGWDEERMKKKSKLKRNAISFVTSIKCSPPFESKLNGVGAWDVNKIDIKCLIENDFLCYMSQGCSNVSKNGIPGADLCRVNVLNITFCNSCIFWTNWEALILYIMRNKK